MLNFFLKLLCKELHNIKIATGKFLENENNKLCFISLPKGTPVTA